MSGGGYPPGGPIFVPRDWGPMDGEMMYPGEGYLPRPGEDRPAMSAWGRLSRGGAMGKKANLTFNANGAADQAALVPILQIQGDDADALQLVVTLCPPSVVAQPFSTSLATQNKQVVTGEQDNIQMQSRVTFPGTGGPIVWPPFEAVLQWGVGGTSNRAEVDFVNGAQVTVVASWLRVFGAVVSGSASGISGTSAIYTLAAFVGPGLARGHARKTIYVGAVDALAESAVFPIPRFAERATVVSCDPAAGPAVAVTVATLRFWQSPDGAAGGNNVGNFVVSGNQPVPFTVPAGAGYASVLSGMGIASRMAIVYDLSI